MIPRGVQVFVARAGDILTLPIVSLRNPLSPQL